MTLYDVNDREFVLRTVNEFKKLGRLRFLSQYGFDAARKYFLVVDGKEYDSKAIVGVAHKFARRNEGPLRAADFSGGYATVVAVLQNLGFEVRTRSASGDDETP